MLQWTGERFLPWLRGAGAAIHYEHLQRYEWARHLVSGKRVLDLGCGEGYGAFLLARDAREVVGADIDADTIVHARNRYGSLRRNLTFIQGTLTEVPVDQRTFDVVVCFEALEHIAEHDQMLAEVRRLLAEGGVFVVSTPNRRVYSDQTGYSNPFHLRELYFDEFDRLLQRHFARTALFGQRVYVGSSTWGLTERVAGPSIEVLVERTPDGYSPTDSQCKEPMYFVGLASDAALPATPAEHRLLDVSDGFAEELAALHQTTIRRLQEEAATLSSEVEALREHRHAWNGEREAFGFEVQRLAAERDAKQSEMSRIVALLEKRDQELDLERARLGARLADVECQLDAARAEAAAVADRDAARDRELDAARMAVQRSATELTDFRSKIATLSDALAVRDDELLQQQNELLQQQNELLQQQNDVERLGAELDGVRFQRDELSQELIARTSALMRVESELARARDDLDAQLELLRTRQGQLEQTRLEIRRLDRRLESVRRGSQNLAARLSAGFAGAPSAHEAELARALARARYALDQVQRSRSWRLTTPLRLLVDVVRRARLRSRLLLAVDDPVLDGSPVAGQITVVGWATSPAGIASIELLCDGRVVRAGITALPRPDVVRRLSASRTITPGFALEWETASVAPGSHVLTVRARDHRGRVSDVAGTVDVTAPLRIQLKSPLSDAARVSGSITVVGWAAGPAPVDRIDVLCNDQLIGSGSPEHSRPDAGSEHPNLVSAVQTGFTLSCDLGTVPLGIQVLVVRAIASDGRTVESLATIDVYPPLTLFLDYPPPDAGPISGALGIAGWAAGADPVTGIEVFCDDRRLAVTGTGRARPDVADAFPDLLDAGESGFEILLDPVPLSPGTHVLAIRAIDACDRVATVQRRIVVADGTSASLMTRPAAKSAVRLAARTAAEPLCGPVALYTSSEGNYFFAEIRELLAAGFEELGIVVDQRDERDGFASAADWHIVIAPHEFFHLGQGRRLLHGERPDRIVVVNTEQPSSQWFPLAFESFSKAHAVWDINRECARLIGQRGYRCSHLALGYSARSAFDTVIEVLPDNNGTCFLEPEVRTFSASRTSLATRPIDLLFVGHVSPRRERFFAEAAHVLSRYRCYLHLSSADVPVISGRTTHLDTATVIGLAQRSKIVLSLHHGRDRYFEWHRIVLQGLWQRSLVITETCGTGLPFRPGVDFVEAPLEGIPERIEHYLSGNGRSEADAIAQHGYESLTVRCRLPEQLRAALAQLPPRDRSASDSWAAMVSR